MARQFIAVDGEGYTNGSGVHLMNLLGASDGSYIDDHGGLSTRACFDYLLDLRGKYPKHTFVSFYFSYDANEIMRGLHDHGKRKGFSEQARLVVAEKGYVYIQNKEKYNCYYHVEYNPKKFFVISECIKIQDRFRTVRSVKIYDTFGFFQSSFLGALYTFKVGTPEQLKFIAEMKLQRSDFTVEEFQEIIRYNQLECELLVNLMEVVDDSLQEVDINLTQWHGAGAVAAAVLKREKVKTHLYAPQSDEHKHAVMSAYFGGRVQCLKIGKFEDLHGYDIVSAYPAAMNELASLSGATEEFITEYEPNNPYAVYKVQWSIPSASVLTPLPFRNPDGTIEYPYYGTGYYWQAEIAAAMEVFGEECFTIIEGYAFRVVDPDSRPFEFIRNMFEFRKVLKARGSMAQICIKLALNSLYGKMAQGIGYRNQQPPFQCYIYAGMITAATRASVLRAAGKAPDAIISFATDGIISRDTLDLKISGDLGDWEYQTYDKGFIIKPGFYKLDKPEGSVKKVRGFPAKNIDFDHVEKVWDSEGLSGHVLVPTQQFIGLKSASENRLWGQWIESDGSKEKPHRKLSFYPSRGNPERIEEDNLTAYQLIQEFVKETESAPYYKGIHTLYDEKKYSELEYFADDLD